MYFWGIQENLADIFQRLDSHNQVPAKYDTSKISLEQILEREETFTASNDNSAATNSVS